MTTALGIAAVMATLRQLLRDDIADNHLIDILGVPVDVNVLPPDRILGEGITETSQLNLFLYRVSPNCGWNNLNLPSRDGAGSRQLSSGPLPLNLHFLLTAYGGDALHGEILLGYGMRRLHERPVLTRDIIRKALAVTSTSNHLEQQLVDSALENQIELVKIIPEPLDTEEMSKLWTAMSSNMRPSAAYKATVVLLESEEPASPALPVLTRGKPVPGTSRDEGVAVQVDPASTLPVLERVVYPEGRQVACPGDDIELAGRNLYGAERTVLLVNDRFAVAENVNVPVGLANAPLRFTLASGDGAGLPVGVYSVGVRLVRPGESALRESNRLALTMAPKITVLPALVERDSEDGAARFTISFTPGLRKGQQVVLLLGQEGFAPEPHAEGAVALDFVIPDPPLKTSPGHLVRLRVDGIESPIINHAVSPPQFLDVRMAIT